MRRTPGPVVTRRRLGGELRRLRDHSGLKLDEVARLLECSPSKISRLENGKGVPRWRDVRDLLDVYGVAAGDERERLLEWSRTGRQPMWWSRFGDVLPADVSTYVELEWDAVRIRAYEPHVVHGLLQTREYARAVERAAWGAAGDPERVDRLVDVRLQRQEALTSDHGLTFTCVLDESVLHRAVGSEQVRRAQLEHLAGMAEAEHVEVRVLPFSAGLVSPCPGPFSLLEFGDEFGNEVGDDFGEGLGEGLGEDAVRTIAHVRHFSGEGDFPAEPTAIERLERGWAALLAAALPEKESVLLLESAVCFARE